MQTEAWKERYVCAKIIVTLKKDVAKRTELLRKSCTETGSKVSAGGYGRG